jgi:hypothetical protein
MEEKTNIQEKNKEKTKMGQFFGNNIIFYNGYIREFLNFII